MGEALLGLLCFLVSMAFLLAIVAVIGHGIWVAAASIFGSAPPPARERPHRAHRRDHRVCFGCGETVAWDDPACPSCGLDPDSRAADELRDLEATARTVQLLRDAGTLPADTCEQVYRGIEARQESLLPGHRARHAEEQLEAWFGNDLGAGLSIDEKRQALATARVLKPGQLRELSPNTLVGLARLLEAVGMLSRACHVYQALFACHPAASVIKQVAAEAIRLACKHGEWHRADEFVRIIAAIPGLVESRRELALLIHQVAVRDLSADLPPTDEPIVEVLEPIFVAEKPPADILPIAERAGSPIVEVPVAEAPAAPAVPRRSFAAWIGVFMEERNILWGELIGGTLIVGCSIALVISLWQTLEQIPFFPFLIFAAITSALFGAGFYTLHHWKLESTSRGLLLIATLLAPLDFLVLAGLTKTDGAGPWDYAMAITALAAFGWFLYRSSHILVQAPLDIPAPSALLIAAAMIVNAAAQLVAPALLTPERWQDATVYPLTLLPVAAQVAALGWLLLCLAKVEPWSVGRLAALLIAMGSVTFACSVTLTFPVYVAEESTRVLPLIAPAVTLLGVPILIAGTLMHRKLAGAAEHGLWRTLGTGLALTGLFVMFGGFGVSVDDPGLRWLCGGINVAVLLAVAWGLRAPALHVAAQVYVAALIVYGWRPDIDSLMQTPALALRLAGLFVMQALSAEAMIRLGRDTDARYYAVGGAVATVLAGVLALPFAATNPDVVALVLGSAAVTWYGANLRWRFAEITYACSLVLAAAIFFAFRYYHHAPFFEQLLWSLLTHATITLMASLALRLVHQDWLTEYFRVPLQYASLLATGVVATVVFVEQYRGSPSWTTSCAACIWLAALWSTIALLERWPLLFGAMQIALAAAWVFGAGGWLTGDGWDWREPYSLHINGLGIGALSLLWEVSRFKAWPRLRGVLAPPFVPIDRVLTGALVIGQYALMLTMIPWSVGKELSHSPDDWRIFDVAWHDNAYSLAAWALPVLLVGVLLCSRLAPRNERTALEDPARYLGLTLLLLTVPLLVAGACFDAALASASAVRWGLATCYGIASLALCQRHRLGAEPAALVPALAIRGLLLLGAVAPVLLITLIVTATKLGGGSLPGPAHDSIFAALGGPAALLVPLALLCAALAGHGFRERLAYYLLAAGLLANASAVGGYFLGLQMNDIRLGPPWIVVDALLLAAGVAGLWSITWTWIASLLEQDETRPLLDSPLLTLNNLLGAATFGVVLLGSLNWIAFRSDDAGRQWTQAGGSMWAWLAFGLVAAAACFHVWQRSAALPLHLLGTLSLSAVGVIACSIEVIWPDQGFTALMFLSGVYACVWVWSNLLLDAEHPPSWLACAGGLPESVLYAAIPGSVAVLLGVMRFADAVWSADAIVLAALACGLLAYQRRTEIWPSLASLLLMPAATILVLHFGRDDADLFLLTIHVNVAVLGAASLARLGLHRFVSREGSSPAQLRTLPIQIVLGMAANGLLLFIALLALVFVPDHPGSRLQQFATWAGWLALLANLIAAIWYVGLLRLNWVVHGLTLGGLMVGIVLAGAVDSLWPGRAWLGHHVLTLSWTLLALLVMVASWASHAHAGLGPQFWPAARRERLTSLLRGCFPESTARVWVTLCGACVVVLALRATWVEPAAPWWSVGNTLAVSVLLGALALWSRARIYTYGSGLLVNVIGMLLFTAWAAHRNAAPGPMLANDEWFSYLVLAQILSFGAAAIGWSLLERRLHEAGAPPGRSLTLPFPQFAILAGMHLLAIGVGFANGLHLCGEQVRIGMTLAWVALGVLTAAALCEVWRPQRFTRFQLYTCGLLAIALLLHGLELSIDDWYRLATLLLAGYVLSIVIARRIIDAVPTVDFIDNTERSVPWFWNVQLGSAALVVALSLWITLAWPTWTERLAGALAVSLVTLAVFLLVPAWPRIFSRAESQPCYVVLTLGVVIALEAWWAFLEAPAIWLQRSGAALAVVGMATLAYRFALPRLLPASRWGTVGRSLGAVLAPVSLALLLVLMGHEFLAYDPAVKKTPLRLEVAVASSLAILGLAALALWSALSKSADVYGIEAERRSQYVYVAELLVVALVAHLRLNIPALLPPVLGQYWFLAVAVLAFVGIAAAEVLTRKDLPVLATPIRRSAMVLAFVPVLFFRLTMLREPLRGLAETIPGLVPFLTYLNLMAQNYLMDALCWLLLGIFFGWLARLRQSANFGIFAALAVNFGLWVLLGHHDATNFLERPQLWLIPLGLIVLVAEHINRDNLGFWPSLSVRYAGLLCIYLSSTIEMLREMLSELVHSNPLYPIALAVLAVAGMLLGILLRVRAFLLAGFSALLVVVFAQIWNAAVFHSHTWVWWASGIILGVLILGMFALFEKHRNEVLKMLDNMKRWD